MDGSDDEHECVDEHQLQRRRSSYSGDTLFVRRESELTKNDIKHDADELPIGFREQAFQWCTGHIKSWRDLTQDEFEVIIVRGGLTNLLFKCSAIKKGSDEKLSPPAVLLRIYGTGTDLFFSRILGEICFVLLSERRFGPRLYGVFTEGRLEEWFNLRTLGPSEMREKPAVAVSIAKAVAHLHTIEMPFDRNPIIFFNCKKWLAKANELASIYLPNVQKPEHPTDDDEVEALTETTLNEQDIAWLTELYSFGLEEQLDDLENLCLETITTPVVFCHNDLQAGNIMADDEDNTRLIDFEYGNFNFLCYDIANHFAEMMFDYQSVHEYPYYSVTPENFPDIPWQKNWVRNYLMERCARQGRPVDHIEEHKVNRYVQDINRLVCASHFQWSIWSVIQAGCSSIDFPYLEFGLRRFKEFLRQKERLPELLLEIGSAEKPQ